MLGGGDDYTFYLYEHKKEDSKSEFDFVDIAFDEVKTFVGEKDRDTTQWTDEIFDESKRKILHWEKIISIPYDIVF